MARNLNKFSVKKNPYIFAQGINPEGFSSFERSLEEAYLQVLLTNTLGGTFYATEGQLLAATLQLHAEIAKTDAEFMARALVYARNEGLMRLQPIVGLVYLAKANHTLFHKVFRQIIQTPGDLADFVEIVRGGVVPGGMGRSIKTAIGNWLNGLSEYHALKYATGGQGYSLRDILRLTHPKPTADKLDALFLWLADREKWLEASEKRALLPQIDAFERLKGLHFNGEGQAPARTLIQTARLPYEVVTGVIKPDIETWVELMRQMPYFALLRHLNTLQRAKVLEIEAHAEYVARKLSNPDAIKGAKIMPFRLHMAHTMFNAQTPSEKLVSNALVEALELAFSNMPALEGKVCIAPDVSGSMAGTLTKESKTRYIDVAGLFMGALLKLNPQALVLPFQDSVVDAKFNPRDSLMTLSEQLSKIGGGGTAVSAPISKLLAEKIPVDIFIGITDNIEWATDSHGNHGFLPTWFKYKEQVAPNAKAFLLTIAPYRHAVAPQNTPDLFYIYGWHESVLKFITLTLHGVTGQVETIRQMAL